MNEWENIWSAWIDALKTKDVTKIEECRQALLVYDKRNGLPSMPCYSTDYEVL